MSTDLPICVLFLQVFPLVMVLSSSCHADENFHLLALEINLKRNDGQALFFALLLPLLTFLFMRKKPTSSAGLVVMDISLSVFRNIGAVEKKTVLFNANEGAAEGDLSLSQCFDFGTHEGNAAFQSIQNVKVVAGTAIRGDFAERLGGI